MDRMILMFCSLVSCIITVNILFCFMNDRYEKVYHNQWLYRGLPIGYTLVAAGVNMRMVPLANMAVYLILFGAAACVLYEGGAKKKVGRVVEVFVLYIVMAVSETLGVLLLDLLLAKAGRIPRSEEMLQSMETAFSVLIVLFLYYAAFGRVWKKSALRTRTQYIVYLIMLLYGSVNILVISFISDQENPFILMMIVGCIIFSNLYLLYFIRFTDERNAYKRKAEMMEQQEKLQYENYEIQREKYADVMAILHDVEKHIKQMERLYQEKYTDEAAAYAGQINDLLRPLAPFPYTGNPILNCLLSEKKKAARLAGIRFDIEEFSADLRFMRPVDITTLFGNLIDNAMAAAARCKDDPYVILSVRGFHEMVSVRIANGVDREISIKNGELQQKGIGILNIERCVNTYEGSISYTYRHRQLACSILLNRTEDCRGKSI